MNLNEWLSFIDELASKHNFDEVDKVFEMADFSQIEGEDKSDLDVTNRSVSFVGDVVK